MRTNVRHATAAKAISLNTLARQMFEESAGDMTKATEKLANYCENFPRLSSELLRIGARSILNSIPTVDRKASAMARGESETTSFVQSVPHRLNEATKAAQARVKRLGASSVNAIMNDKYTIGSICKPLRDWLGTDILEHGQKQLLAGQTTVRNAKFLISVGEAAGPSVIGEALDEATVALMKAQAYEMA